MLIEGLKGGLIIQRGMLTNIVLEKNMSECSIQQGILLKERNPDTMENSSGKNLNWGYYPRKI